MNAEISTLVKQYYIFKMVFRMVATLFLYLFLSHPIEKSPIVRFIKESIRGPLYAQQTILFKLQYNRQDGCQLQLDEINYPHCLGLSQTV